VNGVGTPTYQWYSNSSNATSGGTPVGTNSPNFTPPVFNTVGTFYYYVTVSLSGNGCGTVTSNPSEVIVVADPTLNTQPFVTQTLCQGTTPTSLTVNASGGLGAFGYQWYSNSPPNTLLPGETNDTYVPDTSVPGTTTYYCVISQAGIDCEVVSNLGEVIIVPAPFINTQPQNRSVCEGETVSPINVAYSNGTGVASYQWFSNSTNSNSGGAIIVGATTDSYNPSSATVGTVYYYCEITFSSGGCSLITSNAAEVNVFQIPVIIAQNVVTCSGDLLNFVPQAGGGNTVPVNTLYTWNLVGINPIGSVTGATSETVPQSGLIQTLVNSTNQVATVTYVVTPIAGICTGNSFTVDVLVYPIPAVVFDIADQIICNETNSSLVTLSSSTPGAITFNWTASVPLGIAGAILAGTDVIPVQTLVNSTTSPLTVIYTAVGTFNFNGFGCDGPASSYSITVNPTIIATGTTSNYNGYGISFFGGTDGFIDLTVTGGSGSYTYLWTGPNGFTATTEDLNGIAAGTYSVIIDDGVCAPTILTFTLTQPPELLFQEDISLHFNLLCFGDSNGVLGITITQESVPPYDFQLINSSGIVVSTILNDFGLNQVFTGLVADTYSVKIIDANGGVKTLGGIIITQPDDIVITAATTPITCYGANDASITLTVSGGTAPYSAQWDNLGTGLFQDNLSAATYTILVTDSNNCTKPITVVIPEALLFTVNPIVRNVSCFGANDGSINLNFVGGIPAITLSWSDGSTAGTTRNNLGPGTYSVTIIDGTPCTISRTFTIVEPQPLVVAANLTNAFDCDDANSGAINLLVSGGTPPFAYTWSNGTTTEDLNAVSAGNYFVTVTDVNGCVQTAQYVISRQLPINITMTTQTDFDCETRYVYESFVAQVTGGIPPYQLQWSSGTISGVNNEIMHSDTNGTVLLTVTDSYGCITTYTVVVATPVLGYSSFDTNSIGYTTYGIYSIGDPIQFQSNVTGDYVSISWDFGDGTFSTELNPVHTYNIAKDYIIKQTVTYPFGCIYVQTISLIVEKGYVLVVPTAFTPNSDGLNDTFRPVTKALKNVQLDIYDTWGSLIYSEKGDVLRGWDAKIGGRSAENGNYYSKVTAETFYGTIVNSNQTFVLIK
jgi:gliding motility-associated-like protein